MRRMLSEPGVSIFSFGLTLRADGRGCWEHRAGIRELAATLQQEVDAAVGALGESPSVK